MCSPCPPPHSSGHLSSLCVVPAPLPTPLVTSVLCVVPAPLSIPRSPQFFLCSLPPSPLLLPFPFPGHLSSLCGPPPHSSGHLSSVCVVPAPLSIPLLPPSPLLWSPQFFHPPHSSGPQFFVCSPCPCPPPHSSGHLSYLCVVPALLPTPLITLPPSPLLWSPQFFVCSPCSPFHSPGRLSSVCVVPAPLSIPQVTSVLCV